MSHNASETASIVIGISFLALLVALAIIFWPITIIVAIILLIMYRDRL